MDTFSHIDPNQGFNVMRGLALIAGFFTLIALGGLWYFGNKKDSQTKIAIEKSRTEAAKANAEAAKANEEVAKANEEVAKANKITKSIELELQKTIKEAEDQEGKVQNLKLQVEKEAIKRAEAETQLLKLQLRVNWRKINKDVFVKEFKKHTKNSEIIEIVFNSEDPETEVFAQSIRNALTSLGFKVDVKGVRVKEDRSFILAQGGVFTSDPDYRGLNILLGDSKDNPYKDEKSTSFALDKAFRACGFNPLFAGGYEQIRPPKGTIKIVIDSRL